MSELVRVSVDFQDVIVAIDPTFADELRSRAYNNYLENRPEKLEFSASDFYFDSFTGAVFEITLNSEISPVDSLSIFSMTDTFLRDNPRYHTPFVVGLMDKWQTILIDLKAINV